MPFNLSNLVLMTLISGCSAYYIVGIPFGVWLAFKCHAGLHGLWIGLTVSLVYGAAVGVTICLRSNWDREVQKVKDRLAADKMAHGDAEANGIS